ncbi:MAG: hypothetical protein K8T25_04375 [Planctomycetia bacterium]|nr:hypothetical protein [Planctomycetia bacterium]
MALTLWGARFPHIKHAQFCVSASDCEMLSNKKKPLTEQTQGELLAWIVGCCVIGGIIAVANMVTMVQNPFVGNFVWNGSAVLFMVVGITHSLFQYCNELKRRKNIR